MSWSPLTVPQVPWIVTFGWAATTVILFSVKVTHLGAMEEPKEKTEVKPQPGPQPAEGSIASSGLFVPL